MISSYIFYEKETQNQAACVGYDEQHVQAHTPGAISERGPASPWNQEDYEFPPSVGPVRNDYSYIYTKTRVCYTVIYC